MKKTEMMGGLNTSSSYVTLEAKGILLETIGDVQILGTTVVSE